MDGVLGDLIPGICSLCSNLTGTTILPDEWVKYDQYLDLGITNEIFLQGHITHRVLENIKIYSEVAEHIAHLRNIGYQVAVITSRGFHPDCETITKNTLDEHGIEIDHLIIVGINESKTAALNELQWLGGVMAYVDDYPAHLHDLYKETLGIKLFLMDRPWNKDEILFERVSNITEYLEHLNIL